IIENVNLYSYYNLFSQGYLESNYKKGHIDLQKVKRSLEANYPNVNSTGNLILDFEGLVYHNLSKYKKESKQFLEAEKEFIDMVRLVKKLRPHLKIGIYGLPFRFYYNNQKKYNE